MTANTLIDLDEKAQKKVFSILAKQNICKTNYKYCVMIIYKPMVCKDVLVQEFEEIQKIYDREIANPNLPNSVLYNLLHGILLRMRAVNGSIRHGCLELTSLIL